MSDIINLLPDSIANQIAAGEVIQRPASVVKELVENAIDAGADSIQLIIKDAGRTLIRVIDNGKGMSSTDARMAFERHATSKIRTADDLFTLSTMGFRGEALPSIAAIAQIELKTKQKDDEIGTLLQIAGSVVENQTPEICETGCDMSVKNIFFNVPARRKFLKSNDTEKRNILVEFERIVLVNPQIEFSFVDNDIEVLKYPASNLKQRIVNVVGKHVNQQLIPIEIESSLVKISGFIGKPDAAKKSRNQQYFFANNRYIRHPYFAKAVVNAFEPLIPVGYSPSFFIFLNVDPQSIDVNIHPTKTEVKFENEQAIWQILSATVKEALGKFNEVPTIDFDRQDAIDIPLYDPSKDIAQPKVNVNPNYNPFKTQASTSYQRPSFDWEKLYESFDASADEVEKPEDDVIDIFREENVAEEKHETYLQYKNKYILTSAKSGLMIIDQRRAHIRILFDMFLSKIRNNKGVSQRMLFPEIVEFSPSEASMIPYLLEDFEAVGFDISNLGNNSYAINGVPSELSKIDFVVLIHNMVTRSVESGSDVREKIQESLALSMAHSAAINYGKILSKEEVREIVDGLFASPIHNHTPDGKTIINVLPDINIDSLF